MNSNKIDINTSQLLGFRIIKGTSSLNMNKISMKIPKSADIMNKIGGKTSSKTSSKTG